MSHKYVGETPDFDGTQGDERCLLLAEGDRDRELLADQLGDGREVVTAAPGGVIPRFDICIADVSSYRRVGDVLAARKQAASTYQPVLLLVSEGGGPRHSGWIAEQLRGTADDVLVIPAPKHELAARVESLLRVRRQSRTLEHFSRAMDEATIGITITDPNEPEDPLVYVNDGFCRLTGYDRDAVLGRNLRFLQGPETERRAVRELRDALDAGDPVTVELTNYRADGEPFRNRVSVNPVRGDDGEVAHHLGFQQDVTERHELTDRLRTETNLLERVFETSPAGITVIDADGDIVRANGTAEEELGLERSEIVSRAYDDPAWDIFDEDGEPIPSEELPAARVLATGTPVEGFTHGIRIDGEARWVSVNAAPLVDEDGDVDGVVAAIEDITDERERERVLEQYESIIETVNDGVWILDDEKRITFVNGVIDEQVGFPPEVLIGTPLSAFEYIFADRETFQSFEGIVEDILTGRADDGQLDVEFDLGDTRVTTSINLARLPGDGDHTSVVCIARDISERVGRERELEQFETIVQTTADPIWVLDTEGRFLRVNNAMVELSGYSRDELIGQHVSMVVAEESVERAEALIRELLRSDREQGTFEGSFRTVDGIRRQYVNTISLLRTDDEFVGTVLAGHDVTDLREQQRRISVLDRVLRHNLRNRMGVIMGYATDLAAHADPEVARLGSTIEESAAGLLQLGESARKFETVVSGGSEQTATVDIVEQVETVVEEARFDHPSVDLVVEAPESATARAHQGFEIAMEEVLENAIAHSDREAPTVRVEVTAGPDDVEVRVIDDGPGIDEIDRRALMRGSETPLEHSQGLGLWLVRWTVESVGGAIHIGDNDPRGSVVTLTLPRR